MSKARAEEVVTRLISAWNARDLDGFVEGLAEDVEWYDPAMADPPARGRAEVKSFAEPMIHAFPDFHYEVLPPLCFSDDGTRCAARWRIRASHARTLRPLGYAPTGRRLEIEGIDMLDLEEGRVKRILTAFDPLPAAEQLLCLRLRPTPGTWRAWLAVRVQRILAWRARGMLL
ncbi:MAG: ester cyclase [Planctomycetota bacterium]